MMRIIRIILRDPGREFNRNQHLAKNFILLPKSNLQLFKAYIYTSISKRSHSKLDCIHPESLHMISKYKIQISKCTKNRTTQTTDEIPPMPQRSLTHFLKLAQQFSKRLQPKPDTLSILNRNQL